MSNHKKNWASALLLSTSVLLSAGIILDNPNVNIAKAIENDSIPSDDIQSTTTTNTNSESTTDTTNTSNTNTGNIDSDTTGNENIQQPTNPSDSTEDASEADKDTGDTQVTEPTNPVESDNNSESTNPKTENPVTNPDTTKPATENKNPVVDKNKETNKHNSVSKEKKKSSKKQVKKPTTKKHKLTKAQKKQLAIKKKEQKKFAITKKQTKLLKIDAKANKKLLQELKNSSSISTNIDTSDYVNLTNWAYFDVRSQSNGQVTAERMNKVAKVMGKTTKMRNANIGDMIEKASKKYNINAGIIFAMTMYETGWGSSNQFVNLNNTGGMECMSGYACEGRWTKFDSLNDSIDRKAKLLAGNLYVGSGRVTLYDIISRYAPSVENNVNQYVNDIGRINEVYLGQKPLTIKGTKLMTEINADAVLQNKGASAYEIKEALKQIELAKAERDTIDAKIKEQKEEQKKLKEKLEKAKEEAKKLQALKDKQEMLKVRDANVENSIDIYQKGQLDEILK